MSRILKEMYETAKGMYKCRTMSREEYLIFKSLCAVKRSGNKHPKKSK
jgi:hypothetical protein